MKPLGLFYVWHKYYITSQKMSTPGALKKNALIGVFLSTLVG